LGFFWGGVQTAVAALAVVFIVSGQIACLMGFLFLIMLLFLDLADIKALLSPISFYRYCMLANIFFLMPSEKLL